MTPAAGVRRLERLGGESDAAGEELRDRRQLGEVAAIEASLAAAEQKLATMCDLTARHTTVHLGMPDFRTSAGRWTTGAGGD